jgi:hypothetical protein
LEVKKIDAAIINWYGQLGKCLNNSWYKSKSVNQSLSLGQYQTQNSNGNGWTFVSLVNVNCYGFSNKVAYVYLNSTHVYEAALQSGYNSRVSNMPTMGILKLELLAIIPGGANIANPVLRYRVFDKIVAWTLIVINVLAFTCTCYCFTLKDNTRKPIMLESDRLAIKFTLDNGDGGGDDDDDDISADDERASRRQTLGHAFDMFHRMKDDRATRTGSSLHSGTVNRIEMASR